MGKNIYGADCHNGYCCDRLHRVVQRTEISSGRGSSGTRHCERVIEEELCQLRKHSPFNLLAAI